MKKLLTKKKLFNFLSLFFLYIGLASTVATPAYSNSFKLTELEKKQIYSFVQTIPVKRGVGQFFMINIHQGYIEAFNRFRYLGGGKKTEPTHETLIHEGFGSILLKRDNFKYLGTKAESEEERINLIKQYVENLQYRAISKKNNNLRVPLFVAVDYESTSYNSLANFLTPPPSSLTLSTTQDKKLIEETGRIVGYQLTNSGINMILGPVLDIEKSLQGEFNTLMDNRSYSSSSKGVSSVATYYIRGLRESGMIVIGKHFPGLGSVAGRNPHFEAPVIFKGDKEDLKDHLKPYYELKPYLNGIMTSHSSIPFLQDSKETPATFSKNIIEFIRSDKLSSSLLPMGYKQHLIFTDAMGMKTLNNYASKNGLLKKSPIEKYTSMSIDAFNAGHDIMIYSNILTDEEYKKTPRKNKVSISQIIKIKNGLADYLNRDENISKYYKALNRIIRAKAALYKLHGGSVNHFLGKDMHKIIHSNIAAPAFAINTNGNINYSAIKNKYREIIEKAYVLLSGSIDILIPQKSKTACVFVNKEWKENYQGIKNQFKELVSSNLLHKYSKENENTLINDKAKNHKAVLNPIVNDIKLFIKNKRCGINFFVVDRYAQMRIVNTLLKTFPPSQSIVLLHMSPKALSKEVILNKNITIMGAFTRHKISYNTDVKAINGDIVVNKPSKLPLNFLDTPPSVKIPLPHLSEKERDRGISLNIIKNHRLKDKFLQSEQTNLELRKRINDLRSKADVCASNLHRLKDKFLRSEQTNLKLGERINDLRSKADVCASNLQRLQKKKNNISAEITTLNNKLLRVSQKQQRIDTPNKLTTERIMFFIVILGQVVSFFIFLPSKHWEVVTNEGRDMHVFFLGLIYDKKTIIPFLSILGSCVLWYLHWQGIYLFER